MKQRMIVSNIRMPEEEWLQVKAAASGMGMSINEYFKYASERFVTMNELGVKPEEIKNTKYSIWNLPKIVKHKQFKPMGLSKEDEEIYGI